MCGAVGRPLRAATIAGTALINAAPQGFVEGHLKIISLKEVELAEGSPSKGAAENYDEYPLIIRSADGKKKLHELQRTRVETIALHCRRGITLSMCRGAHPGMSALNRIRLRFFPTKPSTLT
jgi:hypothetical protein